MHQCAVGIRCIPLRRRNLEEEDQPPGTMHIALDDGEGVEYSHSRYYQGREMAKHRSVLQALTLLRRYLMVRSGARIE